MISLANSIQTPLNSLPISQDAAATAIKEHQRTDRLSEIIRLTEQTVQAQRPAFSRVGWLNYTNEYPLPADYANDADDNAAFLRALVDDGEISAEQFKQLVQAFETQRAEMDAYEMSGWQKIEAEATPHRTNSKRLVLEKDDVSNGTKKKSQAQYIS